MRSSRFVAGLSVLWMALGLGCAMIRKGPETCLLAVVVDGGRGVASAQQIAAVEQRIGPVLAQRGLTVSRDKDQADLLARIELTTDPADPLRLTCSIRSIEANPFLPPIGKPRATSYADKIDAELRSDRARDESEFSI